MSPQSSNIVSRESSGAQGPLRPHLGKLTSTYSASGWSPESEQSLVDFGSLCDWIPIHSLDFLQKTKSSWEYVSIYLVNPKTLTKQTDNNKYRGDEDITPNSSANLTPRVRFPLNRIGSFTRVSISCFNRDIRPLQLKTNPSHAISAQISGGEC